MNRFVLNETSYHGKGAIAAIADEVKARGFSHVFVASDPDLVKFGVPRRFLTFLTALPFPIHFSLKSSQIQLLKMYKQVLKLLNKVELKLLLLLVVVLVWILLKQLVLLSKTLNLLM
jgi:alcohol dehydrogenase class IV